VRVCAGSGRALPDDPRSSNRDLIRPYADGKAAVNVLALTSISGPAETWLIEAHDSFEGPEALDTALAYNVPGETMYRIRADPESDFASLIAQRRRALDSVNLDRPEIAYQVVSGAPAGTYLFLCPLAALKQLDNAVHAPAHMEGSSQIELIRERMLLRMEPRLSYVSDAFAAENIDFWRAK
jgi:hypothetical protein